MGVLRWNDCRPQISRWHLKDCAFFLQDCVAAKMFLGGLLDEFALINPRFARHIPSQGFQLADASRIETGRCHCDINSGAKIALGVASVRRLEQKLARRQVGQKLGDQRPRIASHIRKVVESKGRLVVLAIPPGIANILLIVGFAVEFISKICAV